uniref:Uncharacterized protein n=1 Tax=Physcomitrium patens TaxID=3218 RepID=A0A2K1IRH1_PHYPA|nr:hypothetical protein PHYPA_025981 [Physcomitrium patens]
MGFLTWVPEILEMLEEGDAYTRWQQYGTWIVLDGRPFAETALSSEKERTERMKNKRPTLTLVNIGRGGEEDGPCCLAAVPFADNSPRHGGWTQFHFEKEIFSMAYQIEWQI